MKLTNFSVNSTADQVPKITVEFTIPIELLTDIDELANNTQAAEYIGNHVIQQLQMHKEVILRNGS